MKEILFIDQSVISPTTNSEIEIEADSRAFVSFIGKSPAKLIIKGNNIKVWEVIRCGARYHHDGICEAVTKENATHFYCDFYDITIKANGYIDLYKRVKDDFTDYFSGTYKYLPGTKVTALDWIANDRIVCGNGLHLCATKEQSEQWNEGGRLLKCEVRFEDICIFPYNISQVRCREVCVYHARHCHYIHYCDEDCDCEGDNT